MVPVPGAFPPIPHKTTTQQSNQQPKHTPATEVAGQPLPALTTTKSKINIISNYYIHRSHNNSNPYNNHHRSYNNPRRPAGSRAIALYQNLKFITQHKYNQNTTDILKQQNSPLFQNIKPIPILKTSSPKMPSTTDTPTVTPITSHNQSYNHHSHNHIRSLHIQP